MKNRAFKRMKCNAAKAPRWVRDIAARTFDQQGKRKHREALLGSFGAASEVRHIDPADYLAAAPRPNPHSPDLTSSPDQADSPAVLSSRLLGAQFPGPRPSGVEDGQLGIPSFEAGGAKMDECPTAHPDRAAPAEFDNANSKRAVQVSSEVA